ncbi:hypothetical protein SOASR015_31700 [Pectobacterium carotovorum subsp. carotovorum]|nr:hypothetical protein SOASR015_31700 [Pectobacterium carotovorum subsp. carotovorum]GLX58038.1 hypothetical protein Pcaca02_33470 [Pectobacterium carotovorum subsp. carotovorum]
MALPLAPEGAFGCLPAKFALRIEDDLRLTVLAAGDKVGFPASVGILPLLNQQLPAGVYPVSAGNAFTVAVIAHFYYLVAIPRVVNTICVWS